jgi:hypothetical protein
MAPEQGQIGSFADAQIGRLGQSVPHLLRNAFLPAVDYKIAARVTGSPASVSAEYRTDTARASRSSPGACLGNGMISGTMACCSWHSCVYNDNPLHLRIVTLYFNWTTMSRVGSLSTRSGRTGTGPARRAGRTQEVYVDSSAPMLQIPQHCQAKTHATESCGALSWPFIHIK